MTAKAALCKALLDGKVINIKNGFTLFGLTNVPREVGRSVERAFNVEVSRTPMDGTTRYGQSCNWVDYRLNRTEYNQDGIKKMKEYVAAEVGEYLRELRETEKPIPAEFKDGVEKYLQPELFD